MNHILLDYSQIVISSTIEMFSRTKTPVSIGLLRHIALNNIQFFKTKFGVNLDNMTICCDGRNYWRKEIFPLYKQNRKLIKENSSFDWNEFFKFFNEIKNEIKTELPFRVIEVEGCEADDVIAVLSQLLCPSREVVIISSDKDLIQLQDLCKNARQWSPFHKKFITPESNEYDLFSHIVRGDAGDGIPNIFSDDDCCVNPEKRNKQIREKVLVQWKEQFGFEAPEQFCKDFQTLKRFERNRKLIDLRQIPESVMESIKHSWNDSSRPDVKSFDYLTKHKMVKILANGGF